MIHEETELTVMQPNAIGADVNVEREREKERERATTVLFL